MEKRNINNYLHELGNEVGKIKVDIDLIEIVLLQEPVNEAEIQETVQRIQVAAEKICSLRSKYELA
jgi:hypothetical protein